MKRACQPTPVGAVEGPSAGRGVCFDVSHGVRSLVAWGREVVGEAASAIETAGEFVHRGLLRIVCDNELGDTIGQRRREGGREEDAEERTSWR